MSKTWESFDYHPISEQLLAVLRKHTQNTRSDTYFRVLVSYFMAQMASSMRCVIVTKDRGRIPVNTYACALMESGAGKGHSMNIMEDHIVHLFKEKYVTETFPRMAEDAINEEAQTNSIRNATTFDEELEKLNKEFFGLGAMPYSFSEGTGPAYKQVRIKAQMAGTGSLNFIMDEVGSNLLAAQELLTVCLETYDVGKVKEKITKSSSDNIRQVQRADPVPSNMIVFGTPAKVFNGGKEENEFISLQETGYARRFLFGFGNKGTEETPSAEELYDTLANNSSSKDMGKLASHFAKLAESQFHGLEIAMDRTEGIALLQYKLDCEALAERFPEHEHIRKAELQHRYFKALKLAGAYAFIDCTGNITMEQLFAAIKIVEDSGKAFEQIMSRPKPYERLAKYISTIGAEVTHADLVEALPFYRGSNSIKSEMIQLAQAWGYKNNIIIKKYFNSGIEFLRGESLQVTDLDQMILSYSDDVAYRYMPKKVPFSKLNILTQNSALHWANHAFVGGHRQETNAIPEFNMIVLDIDDGVSLATVKEVLKEYTAHYYTTKRHQKLIDGIQHGDRFRVVIPMLYHLKLDADDFKEFMANVYNFLPFKVDAQTNQRCRKWESNKGHSSFNEGILLDPLQFIPKTAKNEEREKALKTLGNLDSAERWFADKMQHGNRNNSMIKFALMLKDSGMPYDEVEARVDAFNSKLSEPLSADELGNTIFKSIANKYKENPSV